LCAFNALTRLVGIRKSVQLVKKLSDEMLALLSDWSEMQVICILVQLMLLPPHHLLLH